MRFSAQETSTSAMVLRAQVPQLVINGRKPCTCKRHSSSDTKCELSGTIMPSSEVRYQRGDVYRPFDEDILRARRSSSSTTGSSSVLSATKRGGPPRSRHSAISAEIHRSPMQARCSPEEYLTKKKVGVQCKKQLTARSVLIPK